MLLHLKIKVTKKLKKPQLTLSRFWKKIRTLANSVATMNGNRKSWIKKCQLLLIVTLIGASLARNWGLSSKKLQMRTMVNLSSSNSTLTLCLS